MLRPPYLTLLPPRRRSPALPRTHPRTARPLMSPPVSPPSPLPWGLPLPLVVATVAAVVVVATVVGVAVAVAVAGPPVRRLPPILRLLLLPLRLRRLPSLRLR